MVSAVLHLLRRARPGLEIQVGYLDHGSPLLTDCATSGAVVVPLLLTTGFHVKHDIAAAAPEATVARPIGPDPRLMAIVADRLRAAGWDGGSPVTLAATGSADPQSLVDARVAALQLAEVIGTEVTVGFVSAGEPRLTDLEPTAVASYLLAPGHFADEIARSPAGVVSLPIGADPRVAEVILDRYDAALSTLPPGRELP